MRLAIIIVLAATLAQATDLTEQVRDGKRDAQAIEASILSTNTAYVSIDTLVAEVKAANNAAKLQAVLLKMLGRMDAEAGAKKVAKEKVKKDKTGKAKEKVK